VDWASRLGFFPPLPLHQNYWPTLFRANANKGGPCRYGFTLLLFRLGPWLLFLLHVLLLLVVFLLHLLGLLLVPLFGLLLLRFICVLLR
jgi:hypothetical protein